MRGIMQCIVEIKEPDGSGRGNILHGDFKKQKYFKEIECDVRL